MMLRCIEAAGVLERNFLFTNQLNVLCKRNITLLRHDGFHFYDIAYRTIDEIADRVLTQEDLHQHCTSNPRATVAWILRSNQKHPDYFQALLPWPNGCRRCMEGLYAPCDSGLLAFPTVSEAYLPWYGSKNPRGP